MRANIRGFWNDEGAIPDFQVFLTLTVLAGIPTTT